MLARGAFIEGKEKMAKRKPKSKEQIREKFYSHINPQNEDDCWNWQGCMGLSGYGAFCYQRRNIGAHRASYEIHYGPIPSGLVVMHTCDNTFCVNPKHLRLGTQADNARDCQRKCRNARGEKSGTTRLTNEDIFMIRRLRHSKLTQRQIAEIYNIRPLTISKIQTGKAWKHLFHINEWESLKPWKYRNMPKKLFLKPVTICIIDLI